MPGDDFKIIREGIGKRECEKEISEELDMGPLYHLQKSQKGQLNWTSLLFCEVAYCLFCVW